MRDMVYQGTVWGPPLWNVFYADARTSIEHCGFEDIVYADDLNAFKVVPAHMSDVDAFAAQRWCQETLHTWGRANSVTFDASKESAHIVARTRPVGDNFTILGVEFDCKLVMGVAVHKCAVECGWRLLTLVRTRRFHTDAELLMLFETHLVSYIEHRTPAFAHASSSVLAEVDAVQERFLRTIGVTEEDALHHFRLAPLPVHRDIAMLGLVHRCVLGRGPAIFRAFFCVDTAPTPARCPRRHGRHLCDPCGLRWPDYALRSALGAARLYNLLPDFVVAASSVSLFQRRLQELVRARARHCDDWRTTLSWRVPLWSHPLRLCRDWTDGR